MGDTITFTTQSNVDQNNMAIIDTQWNGLTANNLIEVRRSSNQLQTQRDRYIIPPVRFTVLEVYPSCPNK